MIVVPGSVVAKDGCLEEALALQVARRPRGRPDPRLPCVELRATVKVLKQWNRADDCPRIFNHVVREPMGVIA